MGLWSGNETGADLNVGLEFPEHVVDLVLEPSGQHFVGFIQDKHPDIAGVYPEREREREK